MIEGILDLHSSNFVNGCFITINSFKIYELLILSSFASNELWLTKAVEKETNDIIIFIMVG